MTALQRYEYPVSWVEGTDITRAEQQIFKFYEMLRHAETDCCEDVCIDYPPHESFIEYFPQNPYTQPDLTPDGYNNPPFYVNDGAVFTDITRVSANPFDWPAIITSGLPRIRVNVTGAVKVGLGLVSITAGGIIFITKDDDITTSRWYELTSIGLIDVVAIVAAIPALIEALFNGDSTPEEIYNDEIIEVLFDTPGDHHIDITFLPRVSPETIIGFGGGLRKIELCGQQRPVMEFRQNPDDSCQLQYRSSSTGEWSLMFDYGDCMTNNCCDELPVLYRYTSDGELERSTDGGATYDPAPEFDPRNNSPVYPPMIGDDGTEKRCIAATGAAALIKSQFTDQLTEEMGFYDLGEFVKDWTGFSINSGGNIFQVLITIATNQILALGILAIQAAMTETVYETLTCILFCNMSDDASITAAQLDQITTDVGDQIGGIATLFVQQLINLLGVVGMTNLLRAGGATTGDCSECSECAEVRVWFTNGIAGMTEVFPDELGVYTVTCNSFASGGYYGNIQFVEDVIVDGYNTCNAVNILTISGGDVSVKQECHTGANNYLSTCYALLQWTWTSPWTMTFTLNGDCS